MRRLALSSLRRRRVHRAPPSREFDPRWEAISPGHRQVLTRFLSRLGPGASILDAGCGTGKYWPVFAEAGLAVTGVDRSASMLKCAGEKLPDAGLVCSPLQAYRPPPGSFDAVWCSDVMECLPPGDWPGVLSCLVASLRPGGLIMVSFEAPGPLRLRLRHYLAGRHQRSAGHSPLSAGGWLRRVLRRLPVRTIDWQVGDGYRFWLASRKP